MSRNLAARIAVAAVAIPPILWICYRGGAWLFGMVMLLALIALFEFLSNEGFAPRGIMFWLSAATIVLSISLAAGFLAVGADPLSPLSTVAASALPLIVFYGLTAILFALGKQSPADLFRRHSRLFWGTAYVAFLYPFVFKVGEGFDGVSGGDSLLFLFGLLWVGDTAAMGIGKWLGAHKLAPTVSPRKTVEGFIGGIVGAIAIGILMFFWKLGTVGFGHMMALSVGCSVLGQLGDLVESMWKRSLDIKDSSAIIPGHGGVLDRFDSLLFAAPFMYAYFQVAVL